MTTLRAGLAVALLACSAAAIAAPGTRLSAKPLASVGDRFIGLPADASGSRFAVVAADFTAVYSRDGIEIRPRHAPGGPKAAGAPVLRYGFPGANASPPRGVDRSGVTYNFMVGAREKWVTGLASYARVSYAGLWPGISATYSGNRGLIKYQFDVAPGADASRISLVVSGAEDARIADDGSIEWSVGGKVLRDERPIAWQPSGAGETIVPADFTLARRDDGTWRVGFEIARYDTGKALTVDPAWTAFSGLVGGSAADQVHGVARDAAGNAYACGSTASSNLPATAAYDATAGGGGDAFLVKFNAAGAPQFVTYFGGAGFDACTGIAVGAADGAIAVAGGTTSTDFPFAGTGDAAFRRTKATADRDAFVAKFAAAGNSLVYSGVMGGSGADQANAIALDATGRAFVTGYTEGAGFPAVTGPAPFSGCVACAFVARIAADGTATGYSGSFQGNGASQAGHAVAVDAGGNAYVAGETDATASLPSMTGTFRTSPGSGDGDGFVAKVDSAGSMAFFTILAGTSASPRTGVDRALAIAIDADGTLLVAGETDSANFPADNAGTRLGTGGVQSAPSGNMDGFVVRIAANGSSVAASSYLGGTRYDAAEAVAADGAGGVFVAGTTANTSGPGGSVNGFPVAATSGLPVTGLGAQDGFLARILSASGAAFAGFTGGAGNDAMHAIAASGDGILSVGGGADLSTGLANPVTTALAPGAGATVNGVVLRINPYGPPAALAMVSGSPQSATVNQAFAAALRVKLTDVDGIALEGVSVAFTAPATGASATLSSPAATTDATGHAQVTATANATGGAYNVSASVSGVTPASFALTNVKLDQSIDFPVPGMQAFVPGGTFGVTATATSGLPVSFASATASTCSVAGGTVTMLAAGACTIVASQAGNDTYNAAPDVPGDIPILAQARGDLNGDNRSDLLFRHADGRAAAWLMSGVGASASADILPGGTGFAATHMADFDGDGKADILWQHPDGRAAIWLMNGLGPATTKEVMAAGGGWTVAQVRDLDGDGKADIVWQHTDGSAAARLMSGVAFTESASILGPGTGWHATHSGDFDGDGKGDLLWTHDDGRVAIWLMNGAAPSSSADILVAATGWSVAHARDLDGDGRTDIVWKHTDGSVAAWLMNGLSVADGAGILGAGTGWSVALTGDFDGDGRADLLWRNADGRTSLWLMNGLATKGAALVQGAGSPWTAMRAADFSGDRKADIAWQNADGRIAVWLMDGLSIAGSADVLAAGSGWSVTPIAP